MQPEPSPQNSTPRVSLVMPSFKMADTMEKSVRSALAQTESDLEIIIVDDCSPDNTTEVANALAAEDPRVRVFRMERNSGRNGACNFGMRQARGKWAGFLDADDWIHPTRIQKLVDAAEAAHVEMATDNQVFVDSKAALYVGTALPEGKGNRIIGIDEFLTASDTTASFDLGMLKQIYRTDFMRAHDVRYHDLARAGEDFYGLLTFFAAGGRALLVDEPLYYYVQPYGTVSRQGSHGERKRYRFETYKIINDHYIEALKNTLTPPQMARLRARGDGIDAMTTYHQLRECLQAKDLAGAVLRVVKAHPAFWCLLYRRLSKHFFGPKPDVTKLQPLREGEWYRG